MQLNHTAHSVLVYNNWTLKYVHLYWAALKINCVKQGKIYMKFTFTAALYAHCDYNTTHGPVCLSLTSEFSDI